MADPGVMLNTCGSTESARDSYTRRLYTVTSSSLSSTNTAESFVMLVMSNVKNSPTAVTTVEAVGWAVVRISVV